MRRKEKLSRYKEETLNERNNLGKSESIEKEINKLERRYLIESIKQYAMKL